MMDAKDAWPEFNLFTAGYSMSQLPHTDERYARRSTTSGRHSTFAPKRLDCRTGDFSKYMVKETTVGPKRACYNSCISRPTTSRAFS